MLWLEPKGGWEETGPSGKSYMNLKEAEGVVGLALRLRKMYPCGSIAVITMYKGQLMELMRLMPASANVEVLTVDSCQGSEFEHVIVSPVRSNNVRSIGFLKDKQRICVAISRCMRRLFIVGDRYTLTSNADWEEVSRRSETGNLSDWSESKAVVLNAGESLLEALKNKAPEVEVDTTSAVTLMQQQASFQARRGAPKRETFKGSGKGAGKGIGKGGKGMGGSGGSGGQYKGSGGASSNRYAEPISRPSLSLNSAAAFPSLVASQATTTNAKGPSRYGGAPALDAMGGPPPGVGPKREVKALGEGLSEEARCVRGRCEPKPSPAPKSRPNWRFQDEMRAALSASAATEDSKREKKAGSEEEWGVTAESLPLLFPDAVVVGDVLGRFRELGLKESEAVQRAFVVLSEIGVGGEDVLEEGYDQECDYQGVEFPYDQEEEVEFWNMDDKNDGDDDDDYDEDEDEDEDYADEEIEEELELGHEATVAQHRAHVAGCNTGNPLTNETAIQANLSAAESTMVEMGFDLAATRDALARHAGDVAEAIEWMYSRPQPDASAKPAPSKNEYMSAGLSSQKLLESGLKHNGVVDVDVAGYIYSVLEALSSGTQEGGEEESTEDTVHALVQLLATEGVSQAASRELLDHCMATLLSELL